VQVVIPRVATTDWRGVSLVFKATVIEVDKKVLLDGIEFKRLFSQEAEHLESMEPMTKDNHQLVKFDLNSIPRHPDRGDNSALGVWRIFTSHHSGHHRD